jgi:hypothetical protein
VELREMPNACPVDQLACRCTASLLIVVPPLVPNLF